MIKPHNKARELLIDGKTWWWLCGKGNVVIWDPDHIKHVVRPPVIKGIDWTTFERGKLKGTSDGMVYPSEVVDYIRSKAEQGWE